MAFHLDDASVVLHVHVGDEQPQTGSVLHTAGGLGGKIGVEDFIDVVWGDSLSAVADDDLKPFRDPVSRQTAGGDLDTAAGGGELHGI